MTEKEKELSNVDCQLSNETEQIVDSPQQEQNAELTAESVVEAVLFASDEPLSADKLADIAETSPKQIRQHIQNLNDKYTANGHAFRIDQIASGFQMMTLSCYGHWLKKLLRARDDGKTRASDRNAANLDDAAPGVFFSWLLHFPSTRRGFPRPYRECRPR